MIEKIIKRLKRDPNYKWESDYSFADLWIIGFGRVVQIIRGLWLKLFLGRSNGLLFVGRNAKVKHARQITAGKNLILEDHVSLNALSYNGIKFGDNVSIGRDSILFCTGVIAQKGTGISIGDRTGINARAYLAGQGGITIGNDVIMGPGVSIFSENHNFNDLSVMIKYQGVNRQPTSIGNNCWLGADCKILAGVSIDDGCVVAAGSVVTKSFPAYSVIAGVPAKLLKSRG